MAACRPWEWCKLAADGFQQKNPPLTAKSHSRRATQPVILSLLWAGRNLPFTALDGKRGGLFTRNSPPAGNFFRPLLGQDTKEILTAFLPQFYLRNLVPKEIVVSRSPDSIETISNLFAEQAGHKVVIKSTVRGRRAQALTLARNRAEDHLMQHLVSKESYQYRFASLCRDLNAERDVQRIECYDISHTGGEAVVASCVVFNRNGPDPSEYRRFNIKEALWRSFSHQKWFIIFVMIISN
mgnify:CR=1 FL=1